MQWLGVFCQFQSDYPGDYSRNFATKKDSGEAGSGFCARASKDNILLPTKKTDIGSIVNVFEIVRKSVIKYH